MAAAPLVYSIDVECVATGVTHDARAVAQVALVDGDGCTLLNLLVRPEARVVSYLTPLTGLSAELLDERGVTQAEAVAALRAALPRSATLVGQSIAGDCRWLGLVEGTDFAGLVDLAGLFRVWNERYKSWSVFSQEHLARCLLGRGGDGAEAHDAAADAATSVALYRLHELLKRGEAGGWDAACERLLAQPPNASFARRHPTFEGVCMGNRKTCVCGAPQFF